MQLPLQAEAAAVSLTREEALASFSTAPLLPEPDQLRLYHIFAPLALLIEGPFQDAVIDLITPGCILEEVVIIS